MHARIIIILFGVFVFGNAEISTDDYHRQEQEQLISEIMEGVKLYARNTKRVPEALVIALQKLQENEVIQIDNGGSIRGHKPWEYLRDTSICVICNVLIKTVQTYKRVGGNRNLARFLLIYLCKSLTPYKDDEVCAGIMDLNIDIFIYIFDEKPWLSSNTVCGIILQEHECHPTALRNWKVKLAPGYSLPRHDGNHSEVIGDKVIQITDIHYDSTYEPQQDTDCGQPICCSKYNKMPSEMNKRAGYWGDYRTCDMPKHAVLNLLQQINQNHRDADFVYFTGDVIAHRIWNTSVGDNTQDLKLIYSMFETFFGNRKVYPVLGNHEPNPLNVWAPLEIEYFKPNLGHQLLFNLIAEEWMRWLPKDTQYTLRRGGYYTALHKPGFRIIGLNSNVCYVYNWWLLLNEVDPYGQLQWLADTLEEAEKNNESVHILSHIPPGDPECLKQWGKQYRRIVNRFANTITAQFNGHTHFNELRLFYNSTEPTQVVNVAYNGGSFTSYIGLNPNYRLFNLASDTWDVLDFDEYVFDLAEANKNEFDQPKWYKLYSFKQEFNLPSMNRKDLTQLPLAMWTNRTLLKTYRSLKYRNSPHYLNEGCDEHCYKTLMCEMVTAEYGDNTQCDMITQN